MVLQSVRKAAIALFAEVLTITQFFVEPTEQSLIINALRLQEIKLNFLAVTTQLSCKSVARRL